MYAFLICDKSIDAIDEHRKIYGNQTKPGNNHG